MSPKEKRLFDARAFLESAGLGKRIVNYARRDVIFTQGDPCDSVMYLQRGGIQISVISHSGKEAVVSTLRAGDFLGEGQHDRILENSRDLAEWMGSCGK